MITVSKLDVILDDRVVLEDCNINFGKQTYIITGGLYKRESAFLEKLAMAYRFYNPHITYSSESGVCYLPTNKILIDNFTVIQNLYYYLNFYKVDKIAAENIIVEFNLEDIRNRKVSTLNRGQKQVVRICCAIVNSEASVVILDEPFRDLARSESNALKQYLRNMQNKKTIIFTKTNTNNVEDLNARQININKRKLEVVDD